MIQERQAHDLFYPGFQSVQHVGRKGSDGECESMQAVLDFTETVTVAVETFCDLLVSFVAQVSGDGIFHGRCLLIISWEESNMRQA